MILFIMGSNCAGKTYVRKEIWPDAKYVDLYDYQKKNKDLYLFERLEKSEKEAMDALLDLVENKEKDEVIIFESVLSNSDRRRDYVKRVKEKAPDEDVMGIWVEPEEGRLRRNIGERRKELNDDVPNEVVFESIQAWKEYATYPSKEEGFSSVLVFVPLDT